MTEWWLIISVSATVVLTLIVYQFIPSKWLVGQNGKSSARGGQQSKDVDSVDEKTIKALIICVLKSLNCNYQTDKEGNLIFEYQASKFRIIYYPNRAIIDIYYLYFYTTAFDHLGAMRFLCNDLNTQSKIAKYFYSIDEKNNEVDVHCSTHFVFVNDVEYVKSVFKHLLNDLFIGQRNFLSAAKEIEEQQKQSQTIDDAEVDDYKTERELFLLREQEMMLHAENLHFRGNEEEALTLGNLLIKAFSLSDVQFVSLLVWDEARQEIEDSEEIARFNVIEALIDTTLPKQAFFKKEEVVLIVKYKNPKLAKVKRCQQLMINLKSEGETDESLYVRVTACAIPCSISKNVAFNSTNTESVHSSFLVAFDKMSVENKLAKLKYMWEDAVEKSENGKQEELSEEQRLILDCTNESVAYDLYFGKYCFLNKRYYEALFYLENAYAFLSQSYHSLNGYGRNKFLSICYYIGFCYTELKLYKQAYYYLSIITNEDNYLFLQEYINCMTNMNDFRAIYCIRNLIERINQQIEASEEDLSDDFVFFVNFIKRRHAFVLINIRQFEEAESLLKEMLEEPANKDFALNELAYLQRIRE